MEASALWTMYYGEPGGDNVIWLLKNYKCYTAEWMVLELCRAVAKKYNQGEINDKEARSLEMFILADIERLKREGRLELIRITWPLIRKAYHLILPLNLYASDAPHLAALHSGAKVMLVDDFHFTRMEDKVKGIRIVLITEKKDNIIKVIHDSKTSD
ncbi:MAG: type II toxin-antitoxin system VapC family toxin [Candidatus Baldrarchaeia archaeon]